MHRNCHEKRKSDLTKIEARAKLVVLALEEISEKKYLTFGCKKHLLVYVAKFIEDAERLIFEERVAFSGFAPSTQVSKVTTGGLYKSETYSTLVDQWIFNNKNRIIKTVSRNNKSDASLRLQVVALSNECGRLKADLHEARSRLMDMESTTNISVVNCHAEELNIAYFAIDALVQEFAAFMIIDADGVVLDNVLRRRIIGIEMIGGYLEWKKKEIRF